MSTRFASPSSRSTIVRRMFLAWTGVHSRHVNQCTSLWKYRMCSLACSPGCNCPSHNSQYQSLLAYTWLTMTNPLSSPRSCPCPACSIESVVHRKLLFSKYGSIRVWVLYLIKQYNVCVCACVCVCMCVNGNDQDSLLAEQVQDGAAWSWTSRKGKKNKQVGYPFIVVIVDSFMDSDIYDTAVYLPRNEQQTGRYCPLGIVTILVVEVTTNMAFSTTKCGCG